MSLPAFEFNSVGRIIFARGALARLGELAAPLGRRALVVYNGCGPADDPLAQVIDQLAQRSIESIPLRQRGEPEVADVDRGAALAREHGCDLLIALGGGSAIDAGKAIAALLGNGGSALDYMEVIGRGNKITKPAAPWIAIPTTAGTGAEATRNAVIGSRENNYKASIRSELNLPRIALIDPQLGVNVPPTVTAASGMDALCQLVESATSTGATPITDGLALQGIPLAGRSLQRAFDDGHDLDAREDMALAALLSGICLSNAGLGAVHGFAAPLGARYPVPHGVVCAALLPHVVAANIAALAQASPDHPTLRRYAEIGRRLTAQPALDDPAARRALLDRLFALSHNLRIPPLSQFGLAPAHIPDLVALAKRSSSMRYNPIPLRDETLAEILGRSLSAP